MLWKHPTSYSYQSYSWVSSLAGPQVTGFSEVNGMSQLTFFDLVTLTYILDLDNLPLDFHVKIQVYMYVRSAGRVRRTHTHTDSHTDRRCQNYYTHHVRDVGCNNSYLRKYCWLLSKKNSCQQMSNELLLWQVGLIVNFKLHFSFITGSERYPVIRSPSSSGVDWWLDR